MTKRPQSQVLVALLIIAFVALNLTFLVRGCNSNRSRADRLVSADPCQAAKLYAEGVRENTRLSILSLRSLVRISNSCATNELIGLMNMPDGYQINYKIRRDELAVAIQQRAAALTSEPPPHYDPLASVSVRTEQMVSMQKWFDAHSH